jgi:hypothetical protein
MVVGKVVLSPSELGEIFARVDFINSIWIQRRSPRKRSNQSQRPIGQRANVAAKNSFYGKPS